MNVCRTLDVMQQVDRTRHIEVQAGLTESIDVTSGVRMQDGAEERLAAEAV
ncbi:MAG: hypothetical protein K0S49_2568, partial [Microbacterium sp.]|nr:hypothetical protein [Microbacterium sp.]